MDSYKLNLLNKGYYFFYAFLILGMVILQSCDKGDVLLWINHNHSFFYDIFFKYFTYLGDGIIFGLVLIYFLISNYFYAAVITLVILIQTLIVQGLKRFLFADEVRPQMFFDNFNDLHQVNGVDIHAYNSFPSGHTATAFAIAVVLSLYFKNKLVTTIGIFAAILVGISRIYLLQHFFIDVYIGSIIGFMVSCIAYYALSNSSYCNKIPTNREGYYIEGSKR